MDLYARRSGSESNLFFSPNSIETALAMTYAGARGRTADQMAAVLHLPPGNKTVETAFGDFITGLNGNGEARKYQLSIANALWGQRGFHFLPDFVHLLNSNYGAGLEEVNFKEDSEGARQTINAWVEKKTNGKIQDLIGAGALTPATRLVLTNAIYFKGTWEAPFRKEETYEETFYRPEKANVPMMHRTGDYGYFEGDDFKAITMPYAGGDLSMIILLPNKNDGLPSLEKELTAEAFAKWTSRFQSQEVRVSLPRFQLTEKFELAGTLTSMGMRDAFGASADFSGMTGSRNVAISDVIHKAFVEVNEQGTEAAAATGVMMLGMAAWPAPPKDFRADHPFLFLIRDDASGAILFMGRLADPAQ